MPNHFQIYKRDGDRLNSMYKGNEESTPRKFNRDKIRMTTICKQEALSPKNKNTQLIKSDSQQAPSDLFNIPNSYGVMIKEKEMFLYDFEEGRVDSNEFKLSKTSN